jgi:predicted nuclease of predicted toxin-antitoxin system
LNFLIDMPVTSRAVNRLIDAGHQAVHAASIGLESAKDAEILAARRTADHRDR